MLSKKLFGLFAGLLCLAATFSASAQNLTVRGTVADAAGPVVGAVVVPTPSVSRPTQSSRCPAWAM